MKLITANKLNRLWQNGFLPKLGLKIDKTKVLTTIEQVSANTNPENIAGAAVAKELINNLVSDVKVNDEGKLVITKGGADSVLNFSKKLTFVSEIGTIGSAGKKKILTEGRPKLIIAFVKTGGLTLTSYGNFYLTGVYLTDDDYNVLVLQGAYTLKEVTSDSFIINNTQDEKQTFGYIYGY